MLSTLLSTLLSTCHEAMHIQVRSLEKNESTKIECYLAEVTSLDEAMHQREQELLDIVDQWL